MPNPYFQFKQFTVNHDRCAMKVTTDSCVFGAWVAGDMAREERKITTALDIGSGTGLLSLMIAQKNEVDIHAVEIDKEASLQSQENMAASPWKDRIQVVNEDVRLFRSVNKFECIVSNPPFYENELTSERKTKNIAHHSEELTLPELLKAIKMNLEEGGLFYLMFPFKRRRELEQLLRENDLYTDNVVLLSQSLKHAPFRVIVKGSNVKGEPGESRSISVWDEEQQYSKPFVDLLKDYYLHL
jgi:tRNA1Val (adenine37-N6)-methyltransferase